MMKLTSKFKAYAFDIHGSIYLVCHPCYRDYAARWKVNGFEATAFLTDLAGDSTECFICEGVIE